MQLDRWIALATITLAGGYALIALRFNVTAVGDPLGPSAFPLTLAVLMTLCALILLMRPADASVTASLQLAAKIGGVLSCLVGFALLVDWLGFLITTTLTMIALGLLFNGPRWRIVAGAIAFALLGYALFVAGLGLRLPVGSLFS